MVQKSGWARRREVKLRAIYDAALLVMDRVGVDAFTLAQLAEETGSATALVYHYFPSKEALLVALQREVLSELQAELSAKLERAKDDPLARIYAATDWYRGLPKTQPLRFRLLSAAIGDPRELTSTEGAMQVLEAARPLLETLAALLKAASDRGQLSRGPHARRAIILWASLHGVLSLEKLARVDRALIPHTLARQLVRDLLQSWSQRRPKR